MPTREEKLCRHKLIADTRRTEEEAVHLRVSQRKSLKWFFVNTVIPEELTDPTRELQVQILDTRGRAKTVGYCRREANELEIDGEIIPKAVLDAARRLTVGLGGQYVDSDGHPLSFQGEPTEWPAPLSPDQAAEQILETAIHLHDTRLPGWRERLILLETHYDGTEAARTAAQLLQETNGV